VTPPIPVTPTHLPPPEVRPGLRPAWQVIGPTLTASVGAFLLTATVGPGWDAMRREMDLSTSAISVFAAYLLPAALGVTASALLGRRWPAAVALPAALLLIPGTMLTAFAPASGILLLGRGLTGFGAGLAWGVTAVLVAQTGARRVWVAPLVAGVVLFGLVLGPGITAFLTRALSWRFPFMLAVLFAVGALLVTAVTEIAALTRRTSQPARPPAAPLT
jgi:MFS family permease